MADVGLSVGGSVSGSVIVGDHNVIIQSGYSSVTLREEPPPRPIPRPRLGGSPLPRGGPEPIGRDTEIRQIEDWLDEGLPVEVIGPPGIGKSLLLRTLAKRRSTSGTNVVFLDAAGLGVEDVVQELFQACYESDDYKPDPARLRRLMGAIRALVIVDGLTATQEEAAVLLDALPSSSLVVSSSRRCLWGEGCALELAGLNAEPANALVERELGRSLQEPERELIETFRRDVDGHPRALIQAAWAIRTATQLTTLPDKQALAGALASGLGEQAHDVLSLLLAADPSPVTVELIERLTGGGEAIARLEMASLVVHEVRGYTAAQPIAALVAEAANLSPEPGAYAETMATWATTASVRQITDAAPLIVTVLTAAVTQHHYGPARDLARAAAPALCRTLHWGAWHQVLVLGKQAAHELHAADDEEYFHREENSRLAALGKGALIGAAVGGAFAAGQHVGQAIALKSAAASGFKGSLLSPLAITGVAAVVVAGVIGGVSYTSSGNSTQTPPFVHTSPTLIPITPPTTPVSLPPKTITVSPEPTTDISGDYVMTRTLASCNLGFCWKFPLGLHIDCTTMQSCMFTGDLLGRHPLSFDGNTLNTGGPTDEFNNCAGVNRPASIAVTLTVTSWQTGQDNVRRPTELTGRLTTSSPVFQYCPAGDAAWDVSVTPGTVTPGTGPDTGPNTQPHDGLVQPPQNSPCQDSPSRETCDQKDPADTGCERDGTLVSGGQATGPLHGTEFTVELWWSPTCQTNWSRARPTGGRSAQFGPWIEPDRGDATRFSAPVQDGSDWVNSPMAYSDGGVKGAKACVIVPGSQQPYWLCTDMLMPDGRRV